MRGFTFISVALTICQFVNAAPRLEPAKESFEELTSEAQMAQEKHQNHVAIELYRQALAIKTEWSEGWWHLGTLLYSEQQFGAAREAFEHVVSLNGALGPGFALLGLCELKSKEYGPALEHLNHARQLGLGGLPEPMVRLLLYQNARLLILSHDFQTARVIFSSLYASRPSEEYVLGLGVAALAEPVFPENIETKDRGMVLDAGAAAYAADCRQVQEAAALFKKLALRYPTVAEVHFLYGSFLVPSGSDDAIREFQTALQIDPKHVPSLGSLAAEYLKRNDTESAVKYARLATRYDPASYSTHLVLGQSLLEAGRANEAIQELATAVKLGPRVPKTRFLLAKAYRSAGESVLAKKELAEFTRLRSSNEP